MSGFPRAVLVVTLLLQISPIAARPRLIGGDEPHYALLAKSISEDQDVRLEDDYQSVEEGSSGAGETRAGTVLHRHVRERHGMSVPIHPVGLPLLGAPLLALQSVIAPSLPPDYLLILVTSAVCYIAFLAGWSLLMIWIGSGRGTLVALAIYFSSPLWFYSRIFVTEGYLASLLVLAIWSTCRRHWKLAGLLLGTAFWIKETALLFAVPLLIYTLIAERRAFFQSGGLFGFAILGWIGKNILLYEAPVVTFQPFQYGNILNGLVGVFLDLEHGLLPFFPLAIVASVGWFTRGKSRWAAVSATAFMAYLLMVAAWVDWRGGSGYGPRLLVPVIPLLGLPLGNLLAHRDSPWLRRTIIAFATVGFAVNAVAAGDPWKAFWSPYFMSSLAAEPGPYVLTTLIGSCLFYWLSGREDCHKRRASRAFPPATAE